MDEIDGGGQKLWDLGFVMFGGGRQKDHYRPAIHGPVTIN